MSSDRHPRGIPTLEERVRSRFEGGMITDIHRPTWKCESRFCHKADALGVAVPSEVLDFIAHKVQSNIRELEGALTRILDTRA